MTDLRTAAQQALEALEEFCEHQTMLRPIEKRESLKAALAEPVQEPVAWSHNLIDNIITHRPADIDRHPDRWTPLYAHPPQRNPVEWDGRCMLGHCNSPAGCENSGECRAIERAHGIGGEE